MGLSEGLVIVWLFCCVFIVCLGSLYRRMEEHRTCVKNKKLNFFTLLLIDIPAFVFSFFMIIIMVLGLIFYV